MASANREMSVKQECINPQDIVLSLAYNVKALLVDHVIVSLSEGTIVTTSFVYIACHPCFVGPCRHIKNLIGPHSVPKLSTQIDQPSILFK